MKDIEVHKPTEHRAERAGGLVIAVFAIVMAVVSATVRSIDDQARIAEKNANDQWAYFQAKSFKSVLSRMTQDLLTLLHTANPEEAKAAIARHASYADQYRAEQTTIGEAAQSEDAKAAALSSKKGRLTLVETLMQIAIGACSIFIATAARPFFWVGGCVGVAGLAYYAFVLIAY